MKKGSNVKMVGIIILILAILSIVGFFISSKIGKTDTNTDNNQGNNTVPTPKVVGNVAITSIYQTEITKEEQVYDIGDKQVTLLLNNNNEVVVNGNTSGIKANYAYVTNQVIIFGNQTSCGTTIVSVIDKEGNKITFTDNDYKLIDFRMYEDKCVARNVGVCSCKTTYEYCAESYDVVFTYDGSNLAINNLLN